MGKDDWRLVKDVSSYNVIFETERAVRDSTLPVVDLAVRLNIGNHVGPLVNDSAWTAVWDTVKRDLKAKRRHVYIR